MTKGQKDVGLPSLRGTQTPGEMYAYHEELNKSGAGRYQLPTRRNLARGAEAKTFD